MSTVMQSFRVDQHLKHDGDLGVEIEVEGNGLPTPNEYWRSEQDGSLRGECREYVLNEPMSKEGLHKAILHLDKAYVDNDTTVFDSVRAGVHVHVNVQDLTVVELYNFITAYIILEDLLVKFCGEYREGNLFCLRIKDADYLLHMLENVAKSKQYHELDNSMLRYASMNVNSLFRYGSLEFRAMRGTRDLQLIELWANTLLNLREVSRKFKSPAEIVAMLLADGDESFLETFLGDFLPKLTNHTAGEIDLSDGLIRAHDLAMETDWESFKTISIGGLDFPVGTEFPDAPMEDF